jgi:hypothetical protein
VILVWLGVIGVHSMLEYPLWYAHFLVVFCLALGLLVRPAGGRAAVPRALRLPVLMVAIAGLAIGIGLLRDYAAVDRLYLLDEQRRALAAARNLQLMPMIARAATDVRFFRADADFVLAIAAPIDSEDLPGRAAVIDRLLAVLLSPDLSGLRAALAVAGGDEDTARRHLRRAFAFFPTHAEPVAEVLRNLALQRPDEFAGLARIVEQELARRPAPRW